MPPSVASFLLFASAFVVEGCAAPAPPSHPATAIATSAPSNPCAVWDRENSFAHSVLVHDPQAFAEHVLPGAVFVDGGDLLRGRDAIATAWAKIVRGDGFVFTWHPTSIAITGDPH